MVRPDLPADPSSPLRRRLLRAAVLAPLAAALTTLPGCSLPVQVDGTFLQPWRSHLQWGLADWQRSLKLARTLGCRQLVLQWTGIVGGSDGDWSLPDSSLQQLFTAASENDIRIRVGLPFQQRWWQAIGADDASLQAFLADSLAQARRWLAQAPWAQQPAFGGWYLPYELEQYHWADPARQLWLAQWLHGLVQAAGARGGDCAISCYFSRLQTNGNLVTLWQAVLAHAAVRPMVQDGVGVAGAGNVQQLQPLLDHLHANGIGFDAIVELFRELPGGPADGSGFKGETANAARVQRQLAWARGSGAQHVLVYALEPWLTQDTPQAAALRRRWGLPQ
ncbi:DUF4434 domain-containing protein [Stenotrophomonas maltophilia]|uniref:DUF4434 domain-containing protein n=1 Tax=Stenotrophomonas maltophilia TaxID=40324 RepID=UPI0013134D45|nr:DUF4434 domain-containing protein [Stenotrophomonas maltophilia]MBN4995388.1 DUF4434 domain-containing protein [Stenotrophomonas maltophilia]MCO7499283.1 DUF4434 domain-containing protein [Stenotrophomonas maltophilia]